MRARRLVPATIAVAACAAAAHAGATTVAEPAPASGPGLDLVRASLVQRGEQVVLDIRAARAWTTPELDAVPGRSLCLELYPGAARVPHRLICLHWTHGQRTAAMAVLGEDGELGPARRLAATVERPDLQRAVLRFRMDAARLRPGRLRWRVTSGWNDGPACAPAGCHDALPSHGRARTDLSEPPVIGCRPRGPWQRRHGSRARRTVALTFDDGPGSLTSKFIGVLDREHVHATFFVLGVQIRGHAAVLRRMLAHGHLPANHSIDHRILSGDGAYAQQQLGGDSARIRAVTGFTPCLFRPPYGATSPALVATARRLGLATVIWDVDPFDWKAPGAGAIAGRVLAQTQRGSIVLMHDAGAGQAQTLAALPTIIHTLRARGYRFVTLAQMFGFALTT